MSNLIQWPTAKYWTAQWNPVIGCKPCSPACEHCYAASWARRFGQSFEPHQSSQTRPPRSGVVFCGNMTDLFGEWRRLCDAAFNISKCMGGDRQATYLWLTKRVSEMLRAIRQAHNDMDWGADFFVNHYFGFTAENQEWFEKRIEKCIDIPGWVNLWLSLEPLLGAIDLYPIIRKDTTWSFKWVVVGCESGPNRRSCEIEWVESIVEQCLDAGVPVFVKQLDIGGKCVTNINKFPEHLQIRQVPWAKEGGAK